MKDNARSKATYYSLARDKLMENHPKIFSFILILALISLTCLAAFLISDILSFGSDSAHKGALVGIDLQDQGKSILAILNGSNERVNLIFRDLRSEPNKVPNGSADANSSMKERGPENLSALKPSNSSRNGTFVSQRQVSGSSAAGGTASSSSSNKQTKKRKVNSSSRNSESISSSAESSKSAKQRDEQLNKTQINGTQQIQTIINQSQQNQSRINDSQVIQLPSNDSQINTSQARELKMDISSSGNMSGGLLTSEPENVEKRNAVNLSSQGNVSISSDSIPVNSSASLAAEDKAQKDLADLDAAGLDSGLMGAKDAWELPEKRLVFQTDSSPELEPENIQKPEEVSSGAASSISAPLNLQVAESIEAEKIDAVADSPKSSTIEFSPEPHKKEGDSGRKSRVTTSSSRDQKKLQIAKAPQTSNRNKRSSNLNKKSTNSRAIPRSKKPSR